MSASACGYSCAGRNSADSGSARFSSERSARAHARCTSTRFEPTPINRFARAPERSSPVTVTSPFGRLVGEVFGQRRDRELVLVLHGVGLGDDPTEPGLRHLVVGAVHQQHVVQRARRRARARSRAPAARGAWRRRACRGRWSTSRRDTRRARAIRRAPPTRTRSVPPLPVRRATRPRARNPPASAAEASGRRDRTCRAGSPTSITPPSSEPRAMPNWRSRTIVSPDTMNSSIRTIHGPIASRPALARRAERGRGLGSHRDVVVEHGRLPVEQEPRVREVRLEHRQQRVEQPHEPQPERLERRVPLAVPVRVRDDRYSYRGNPDRRLTRRHDFDASRVRWGFPRLRSSGNRCRARSG